MKLIHRKLSWQGTKNIVMVTSKEEKIEIRSVIYGCLTIHRYWFINVCLFIESWIFNENGLLHKNWGSFDKSKWFSMHFLFFHVCMKMGFSMKMCVGMCANSRFSILKAHFQRNHFLMREIRKLVFLSFFLRVETQKSNFPFSKFGFQLSMNTIFFEQLMVSIIQRRREKQREPKN